MDGTLRAQLRSCIRSPGWRVWAGLASGDPVVLSEADRRRLAHPGLRPVVIAALWQLIDELAGEAPLPGPLLSAVHQALRPGSAGWQTVGVVGALLVGGREARARALAGQLRAEGAGGRLCALVERAVHTGRCGDGPAAWIATTLGRAARLPPGLDLVRHLADRGDEAGARHQLDRLGHRQRWRGAALVAGVFGDDRDRSALPHARARDCATAIAAARAPRDPDASHLHGQIHSAALASECALHLAWRALDRGTSVETAQAALAQWLPRVAAAHHPVARTHLQLALDALSTGRTGPLHHHWVRTQGHDHVPAWRRAPAPLATPARYALLDWMLSGGFGLLRRHIALPGLRHAVVGTLPADPVDRLARLATLSDGGHRLRDPILAELLRGPIADVPRGTARRLREDPHGAATLDQDGLRTALALTALRGEAPRGLVWTLERKRVLAQQQRQQGSRDAPDPAGLLAPVRQALAQTGRLPTASALHAATPLLRVARSAAGSKPTATTTDLGAIISFLGLPRHVLGVLRSGRAWPSALGHPPRQTCSGGLQLDWLAGWRGRWALGPTELLLETDDRGALLQLVLDRAGIVVRVNGPAPTPAGRRPRRAPHAVVAGCLAVREPEGLPVAVLACFGARPVPASAMAAVARVLLQLGVLEVGMLPRHAAPAPDTGPSGAAPGRPHGEGRLRRLSTLRHPVHHPKLPPPARAISTARWEWLVA